MRQDQVAAILAFRSEAWPNEKISETQTAVWINALKDEPADQAAEAMQELAKIDEFAPTIARFREMRKSRVRVATAKAQMAALPEGTERVPLHTAARNIRMLREMLAEIGTGTKGERLHDAPRRPGEDYSRWEDCPTCRERFKHLLPQQPASSHRYRTHPDAPEPEHYDDDEEPF